MDLTDAPPPAASEPASADASPSLDQMIAEAEAANPGAPVETPAGETPPGETPPETEAKPPAEEPKVEEKTEAKEEGISERSARQILDAAHRKHKQAETHTATYVSNIKRELMTDPSAALEKHFGVTLDSLIDVSTGVTPGAERAEAKPVDDERWQAQERRIAALEAEKAQAVVREKVAEIKGAVTADAKSFPTINARGKHDVVIDFMTEYYNTHGSPIAWKEAAKLVEAELMELVGGSAPAPAVKPPASTPVVPPKPTTALTNGDVRATAPVDDGEPTDPDELIKHLTRQEEARISRRAS
jgi:hypothetical protein